MTTANLTVQDNDTVIQYTSTGESAFTFPFPILSTDELRVSVDQVDKTIGSDYTVSGVGDAGGGTVTFLSATTAGELITIWQDLELERLTGFQEGAATLLGEDLNTEFVRQVRIDQQLRRDIRRALQLAVDDPQSGQTMEIPTQTTRAGKFLAFDAAGLPTVSEGSGGGDTSLRTDLASTASSLGFNLVAITITAAESAAGVVLTDAHRHPGDTRRYQNGLADAFLQAAESGGETRILFAESETISTGLSVAVDWLQVRALPGAILTYSGTGVAVTLGNGSDDTTYQYWDVPIKRSAIEWDDATETTSIGLQIRSVRYSKLVLDIEGFNKGFNSYGVTGGNVHNEYVIRHLLDNRLQMVYERDGGDAGWNNSNYAHSGRVGYRSGTIDTAIANTIVVKHWEQSHASDNDNTLMAIAFEISATSGSLPAGACFFEMNGFSNRILHPRIENSNAGLTQYVIYGADADRNIIDVGRSPLGTATSDFVNDAAAASAATNRLFGFNHTYDFSQQARLKIGAVEAIGRTSSSHYGTDAASVANFVGQNANSAANKIFAALDGSGDVVFGVTGTGRLAIGKDPATNAGHFQLIDEGVADKTLSLNASTWARTTTDDSGDTINIDSIVIPDDSAMMVELSANARHNDGSKVWFQKRTALISKNGVSNAVIEAQTAYATHDPDSFAGTCVVQVTGAQLQILVTGVAATTIEWSGAVSWQHVTADS